MSYGSAAGTPGGEYAVESQRLVKNNAEPQLVTTETARGWWETLFDLDEDIDIEDVVHAIESFKAVIKPVAIVMLIASWCVVNVKLEGQQNLSKFLVYSEANDLASHTSMLTLLAHSVANALVIILIFLTTTMFIVMMYKFKCMNGMFVYMILSSTLLLGLMGGMLAYTFCRVYHVRISTVTFMTTIWNFAAVGIVAIFYGKGMGPTVSQFYLAATSLIMAWQLATKLPEWTSWSLLVTLAGYDLFAVLSPSGPLRILVNMMVEQQSWLPGLIYEADVHYTVHSNQSYEMQRNAGGYQANDFGPSGNPSTGAHAAMQAKEEMDRSAKAAEASLNQNGEGDGMAHGVHSEQIRLGLGDFVFYSILVAKAAMYDFVALASCFLVVLIGLSATLLVVSVFRKAIPALPVSIGLGVMFYLLTRLLIMPYTSHLSANGLFV